MNIRVIDEIDIIDNAGVYQGYVALIQKESGDWVVRVQTEFGYFIKEMPIAVESGKQIELDY